MNEVNRGTDANEGLKTRHDVLKQRDTRRLNRARACSNPKMRAGTQGHRQKPGDELRQELMESQGNSLVVSEQSCGVRNQPSLTSWGPVVTGASDRGELNLGTIAYWVDATFMQ